MLYIQKDNIILRDIDGVYVLIDITKRNYSHKNYFLSINEVGKCIWSFISKKKSIHEITKFIMELLADDEDIDYNQVYIDTKEFLEYLINEDYLLGVSD